MRAVLFGFILPFWLATSAFACGVPPLADPLEPLIGQETLTQADLAKVNDLRTRLKALAGAGDSVSARELEEQVMRILGYEKVYLRGDPDRSDGAKWERPERTQPLSAHRT